MSGRSSNERDWLDESLLTDAQRARRQRKAEKRRARAEAKVTPPTDPTCVECGSMPERVKGDAIYPHRADLHMKSFWRCQCGAYVGCHPFTRVPLGRPAGPATRAARNAAHASFDALWRRKMERDGCGQQEAREAGYAWLAQQLGYEPGKCHIAWMTAEEAARVVEVCASLRRVAA